MPLPLLLAAAFAFTDANAEAAYAYASELVENCTPRDAGSVRGKRAANWILDKASSAGLEVRRDAFTADTPDGRKWMTNLVAEFKVRQDAEWVVVVSHYDTKPRTGCPGANDGASTTGLLIALGEALQNWRGAKPPQCNLMFVWTDGEECMYAYTDGDGFWGSRHAAQSIKRRGFEIKAVIGLDMLGDADLGIAMPENSDAALMDKVEAAAKRCQVEVKRMDGKVKDDHAQFAALGYPAVDLIDFEYPYWHTPEDTIDHISKDSLKKSGMLVAELVGDLIQ